MTNQNPALLEYARALANQMLDDVKLATTRIEHVRLTTRANEAAQLVNMLEEQLYDKTK
jgi:alpha-N-acetylglucosamine transferase